MWLLLCILTLFTSCKRDNKSQPPLAEKINAVTDKQALYCELSRPKYEKDLYVHSQCDGLLFTSLRGIGCGDVDVSVFQELGRWYRDPSHDCFIADRAENGSDSSISKDMLVGVFNYLWWAKDSKAVDDTIKYGEAHDWVMGDAETDADLISKCLLSPGLINILYDMQDELDGGNLSSTRSTTDVIGRNTGFRAHLDVLHILLSGSLYSGLADSELETLKDQADREPYNALFQASYHTFSDGNQDVAADLLLNEQYFPSDRLPTSDHRCEEYLFQRDKDDSDWAPCPDQGKIHSGTDLIFAASVLNGGFLRGK